MLLGEERRTFKEKENYDSHSIDILNHLPWKHFIERRRCKEKNKFFVTFFLRGWERSEWTEWMERRNIGLTWLKYEMNSRRFPRFIWFAWWFETLGKTVIIPKPRTLFYLVSYTLIWDFQSSFLSKVPIQVIIHLSAVNKFKCVAKESSIYARLLLHSCCRCHFFGNMVS